MKSSPSLTKEFVFGSFVYNYELIKQDRKTLALTVTPELQIYVKCPHRAGDDRIEQFLRRKWFWLEKQLSFFEKYQRKIYRREYVSGESFHYLGRQHQLVVKRGVEDGVSLLRGILLVNTTSAVTDGHHTKKLVSKWHDEKMQKVFMERFDEMNKRFEYKNPPSFGIRDMKRRWGSFLNEDKIFLNPQLIHMPKDCIDYVIVHELCHMRYKNHDKNFFRLLEEKFPNWDQTKEKLESVGALVR